MKKVISIVTPCYNEEENLIPIYEAVQAVMAQHAQYEYEHIFIDNHSKDQTYSLIKGLAKKDKRVKGILNSRNFGPSRSPYYGLLQSTGECAVLMAADFQDPPELIHQFLQKWEEGYKIAIGVKNRSEENKLVYFLRSKYYAFVRKLSDVELIDNYTGFGLYDRKILETLRKVKDPDPYFRGLICEIGFDKAIVEFTQPVRKRGKSGNNLLTLYDYAMLGITTNSKAPLRIMTLTGFTLSFIFLLIGLVYCIVKLLFWNYIPFGIAPLIVGIFSLSSIQLMCIGLLGEYVSVLTTRTAGRPIVVEEERINFDGEDEGKKA